MEHQIAKEISSIDLGPKGDGPLRELDIQVTGASSSPLGNVVGNEQLSDARLVDLARGGDDRAFSVLVLRYERALIRVLARLLRDEELARDMAQETFWRVYKRLEKFDTSRRFGPWLFRVGVNLALDRLRRNTPPVPASIDQQKAEGSHPFEIAAEDPRVREEIVQEVHFVLERIPSAYRAILILKDIEGFSTAEVATIVNRREATVRWRLARAREIFRDIWKRRQFPDTIEGV